MSASYFMLRFLRKKCAKAHCNSTDKLVKHEENTIPSENQILCRICLKAGIIPIYNSAQEAIRTFGDVEIHENDSYPKHLCEICHDLLNGAVLFRKTAKESDKFLRFTWTAQPTEIEDFDFSNDFAHEESNEKPHNFRKFNLQLNAEQNTTHRLKKRHKNVRIQCPICHKLFTSHLYNNHIVSHQSASHLICEVCGKLYRKDNLSRHLQLHSYDLPFQCQVCPYRGRFMESLKMHMRTHSGEKPFSCDKCELHFISRSNRNRHLLTHKKEKPHKCIECGRGFYTKRELDVHFKADHSGMKDFSCRMCGNKYGTRKALMRHELRVHKRDKMAKGRMPLYLQAEYRKSDEIICE